MDRQTAQAYEKYVMAGFETSDPAEVEKQRQSAINSLIPGTLHYLHLFFLDLVKKKKNEDKFSMEEKEQWAKFKKDYEG